MLKYLRCFSCYEFRQMAIWCKWLQISKLIVNQLHILYKLRCCWSIHCMKHLWMNWFIDRPRKQFWVMVETNLYLTVYWIRWNFNNACNASFYSGAFFCISKAWCVFHHIRTKYTIYSRTMNLLWIRYEIMILSLSVT